MKKISLGRHRLKVPPVGLRFVGMVKTAADYTSSITNEKEAIAIIHRSLELGGNFLDTADVYGPYENERLIGKAIKGKRDQFVISTKFGYEIDDQGQLTRQINGKPEYVKKAVERSLINLGTEYIDIYFLHRLDPNTPIEETMGGMVKLIREGKIGYIGLSDVSSTTIRRAQKIHPVAAVQISYSLFDRKIEETDIPDTLKDLGIGFMSYAPTVGEFFSGDSLFKCVGDYPDSDYRRKIPRFQSEPFYNNRNLMTEIKQIAKEKDITISQLAVAWAATKGCLPVADVRRIKNLEKNITAAGIHLSPTDMSRLESILPSVISKGVNQYPADYINR
jgi:aryl-alcohol dehydrogenase-like predicted oxidoreductase